jgi:hypothetical protein
LNIEPGALNIELHEQSPPFSGTNFEIIRMPDYLRHIKTVITHNDPFSNTVTATT